MAESRIRDLSRGLRNLGFGIRVGDGEISDSGFESGIAESRIRDLSRGLLGTAKSQIRDFSLGLQRL